MPEEYMSRERFEREVYDLSERLLNLISSDDEIRTSGISSLIGELCARQHEALVTALLAQRALEINLGP